MNNSTDRKSRPNPFNLSSRDNADEDSEHSSDESAGGDKFSGAGNGLYRPPRIQAAPFKVRGTSSDDARHGLSHMLIRMTKKTMTKRKKK
jgi:hypothetical protein